MTKLGLITYKWKYFDQKVDELFKQTVHKNGNKIAIHFKDQNWTFNQLNQFCCRPRRLVYEVHFHCLIHESMATSGRLVRAASTISMRINC